MPRLTDLSRIRTLLDRDRAWTAYALGDLSPEFAGHCEWRAGDGDSPALILVYRGFSPPILFAMGEPAAVAALVGEIDAPTLSLHVRPEILDALAPRFRHIDVRPMWRMAVEPSTFRSAATDGVVSLDESDLPSVAALYEDGRASGDGPTFFHRSMLRQGTFYGVREGIDLIAVAGTHLFSSALGVCAVGNVYTRRDRRRHGLGARVTSAVVQHAIDRRVPTIVLNVGQGNDAARRVYEQLGFHTYCAFVEGEAEATGGR